MHNIDINVQGSDTTTDAISNAARKQKLAHL